MRVASGDLRRDVPQFADDQFGERIRLDACASGQTMSHQDSGERLGARFVSVSRFSNSRRRFRPATLGDLP